MSGDSDVLFFTFSIGEAQINNLLRARSASSVRVQRTTLTLTVGHGRRKVAEIWNILAVA